MVQDSTAATTTPICVVVDSSVWRSEPLLNTPMGRTLLYTMTRRSAFVGLPEVIEIELKNQIVEAGMEAVEKAKGPLHILSTITGNPAPLSMLPAREKLGQFVDERLATISSFVVRVPFTLEHAKAALAMVNAKAPPNDKGQQFKDSAIWQAVLTLLATHSVVLLTNDKAFFRERDPGKGLAWNLVQDCNRLGGRVAVYEGIRPYLKALGDNAPDLDQGLVKELVLPEAMARLNTEAEQARMIPTELRSTRIDGFSTNTTGRLAIDYTLTFGMESLNAEDRPDPEQRGIVHGSAYFIPAQRSLADHYIQQIKVAYQNGYRARSFSDYDAVFPIPRPLDLE